ncbi:MAG: hypothetical protein ABR576_05095 [Thermoanaerobaculia bacterium]
MSETEERLRQLEAEIERRLLERFAALRDEFDRLRLEADRRWAGFLTRFDQDFTGVVPKELLAPPQAAAEPSDASRPPASGQVDIEDVRTLDAGENQVEVLRRFLDLCGRHGSRAVLFVSRGASLEAWKAVGFSNRGGDDEAVRNVSVAAGDETLRCALDGAAVRLGRDNVLSRALDAGDVSEAILVPMVVREKISGLVYADCAAGEEETFHPETVALLTYLAGTVVDRLASRRLRPSPSLKPMERLDSGSAAEPERAPERAPEPRPAPPPAPPAPPPVPSEPPAAEAAREFELAEEAEPAAAEAQPPSFASAPPPEQPAAPPPEPAPTPPPTATGSWQADVEPPPMPASMEPPRSMEPSPEGPLPPPSTSTRRLAGPLAPLEGDERREEARRFARLLVSEIKLYNERAVLEGRQRGDLYSRLREDIDRSRQMYDERIPQDVRSNSNFFYEEMVRILADGRREALGL